MLFATLAVPWAQYPLSHAASFGRNIKKYLKPPFIKYGKAAGSITFITTYWTSVGIFKFFTIYTLLWKLESEGQTECQRVLGCEMFPLTATFFCFMSFFCVTCGHCCCTVTSGQEPILFIFPTWDLFQLPSCLWLTKHMTMRWTWAGNNQLFTSSF